MTTHTALTRRQMLRHSVAATTLAVASSALGPLLAAPGSRGFRIGACDWCLGKRGDPASLDVAKQIGLDGVQIDMGSPVGGKMPVSKPEVIEQYREAVKRTGVAVASVALCELNSVPLKTDPRAAQWLDESLDVCKALGVKVSMPACFFAGDINLANKAEIDSLVKVLKQATAKAAQQGTTIGLESYLSAEDNLRILDLVGSPALAVYYDVGNSTDKGRDVYKEIRMLGKHICEFHAKDGGHILGRGRIDFKKVRQAMDDVGYAGWIQIEAAAPNGMVKDYTAYCKMLKEIFPAKV